jgi:hypothetical protein
MNANLIIETHQLAVLEINSVEGEVCVDKVPLLRVFVSRHSKVIGGTARIKMGLIKQVNNSKSNRPTRSLTEFNKT